jgi:hypothetical protein
MDDLYHFCNAITNLDILEKIESKLDLVKGWPSEMPIKIYWYVKLD